MKVYGWLNTKHSIHLRICLISPGRSITSFNVSESCHVIRYESNPFLDGDGHNTSALTYKIGYVV